jgi:hypothetical protein
VNGNNSGEYIDNDYAVHYKNRIRTLLPYVRHKYGCEYANWLVNDHMDRLHGVSTAGSVRACTCGLAALAAIVHAEVYDENGKPV